MHPYKLQLTQELLLFDMPKILEFCNKLLDMIEEKYIDLENVFFNDETHFD